MIDWSKINICLYWPNNIKHFFSNSKQFDVNQVSELLNKLVPQKGATKSQVANKLKISPQLLGQYMKGRQKPKPDFYKKWKEVYGEDLLNYEETNVSRETNEETNSEPAKSIQDKYTKLLEEQLTWIKEQVRADLSTVKTGLTGISGDIIYARATQRAILEFQLMKDSKGDQKKVEFAKEQINKLIALQFEDEQMGSDVVSDKRNKA